MFQDLQREHMDWLIQKEFTLKHVCASDFNASDYLALSHRWELPEHPDAEGEQLTKIKEFLCDDPHGKEVKFVWIE